MSLLEWRLRAGLPPATFALLLIIPVVYLLQLVSAAILRLPLEGFLGLSVSGFLGGQYWQLFTYQFLHGGAFHLILYFLSGALGGAGWLALTYPYEGICVGASAAIFGLLSAFAVLYPQREVTLLVMFVFPITLKAWVLAVALGAIQLLFTLSPDVGGIAYSAHLAGAVAGLIYTVILFRPEWLGRVSAAWAGARQERRRAGAQRDAAEVERLLDKIAREGIQSLTPSERKRLENASRSRSG